MNPKEVKQVSDKIIQNVENVIIGKRHQIELILVSLFSKGHILIEDVPGLGKTMLARAVAKSIGGTFKRVQGTPDLLPSDILGVSIYNPNTRKFEFRKGPIMSNVVLMDEINRATPKTQSALLEAMGEGQVTVDHFTIKLPSPFIVLATQNPIEFEGTFPLPEAQMDRFFISLKLGYPNKTEEIEIVERQRKVHPIETIKSVSSPEEIVSVQQAITDVFVDDSIKEYIMSIVEATRKHPALLLGASPRGSIALYRASQALAALKGRDFVIPEDVKSVVLPVLRHRVVMKAESKLRGQTSDSVIQSILNTVEVPLEEKTT